MKTQETFSLVNYAERFGVVVEEHENLTNESSESLLRIAKEIALPMVQDLTFESHYALTDGVEAEIKFQAIIFFLKERGKLPSEEESSTIHSAAEFLWYRDLEDELEEA